MTRFFLNLINNRQLFSLRPTFYSVVKWVLGVKSQTVDRKGGGGVLKRGSGS
jgi:hypothetical protein